MTAHRYTLAEAQSLLPQARTKVGELVTLAEELELLGLESNDGGVEAARIRANVDDVLRWFDDAGVQIKSLSPMLLDFPARAIDGGQGIDVLLCWREDEAAIGYYHPPDNGYRGRQPVAMLDRV